MYASVGMNGKWEHTNLTNSSYGSRPNLWLYGVYTLEVNINPFEVHIHFWESNFRNKVSPMLNKQVNMNLIPNGLILIPILFSFYTRDERNNVVIET